MVENVDGYAVLVLDRDGFVRLCNRGVERLWGYGRDEVVGAHHSLFYPPDEDAAGTPTRDLARAAERGQHETEGWRRHKDGSSFWAVNSFTALRDDRGRLDGFGAITRHGNRERELQVLEALFQTSPVGLVLLDRELRVARINEHLARINGPSVAEHLGKSIWEVLPQLPRRSQLFTDVERVLSGGLPLSELEVTAETAAQPGVRRRFSIILFPVFTGAMQAGVGAVIREVTARRRAEEERELFLAALGHDLRNPLAAISMSAQLLAMNDTLDPSVHRSVTQIVNAAQRMARLINDLLDLARARSGMGIPLSQVVVDLNDVCREVVAELHARVPDQPINLQSQCESCTGWYDRDRVFQVVQNLVANAVDHGAPGKPILVSLSSSPAGCTIAVSNQGPPIPPSVRAHLFDPFYSQRRKRKGAGLGLGLYIARLMVEAHGGRIDVDSTEERTVFTVQLPRNEPDRPQ